MDNQLGTPETGGTGGRHKPEGIVCREGCLKELRTSAAPQF